MLTQEHHKLLLLAPLTEHPALPTTSAKLPLKPKHFNLLLSMRLRNVREAALPISSHRPPQPESGSRD